jgi:hypothetical protein
MYLSVHEQGQTAHYNLLSLTERSHGSETEVGEPHPVEEISRTGMYNSLHPRMYVGRHETAI